VSLTRRQLIAGSLAATALWGKNKFDRTRISAITDEIATSPQGAIAFAQKYGMKWLELRDIPGKKGTTYFLNEEAFLRAAAKEFADGGVKISFLNANLLKFGLPGTEPTRRTPEAPEARVKRIERDKMRMERSEADLHQCIRSAHILGTKYIRIFSFSRVAEPESTFAQIAEILGRFATIAEKEGVALLLENETSCNIAKCSELASMMKLVASKGLGINWHVMNGADLKETPMPDGYAMLPKKRLLNVQMKGRSVLDYPQKLDWKAIFAALEHDGYQGQVGLETHIFGPDLVAKSHESLRAILKIVDPTFTPRPESAG